MQFCYMRITQAKCYLKFFRKSFHEKYNFNQYLNPEQPCFFHGCYQGMYDVIRNHRALAVICWCGTDSLQLLEHPEFIEYLRKRDNIYHIADSRFISEDLTKCGIPHFTAPISPLTLSNIETKPIGKDVYIYGAHNDPEFYGHSTVERIKKKLPQINFITKYAQPPDYCTPEELLKIYENSCIGLRLVPHDGMSCTVAELGLMGRKCVWNGNSPNAIPFKNDNDIINAIKQEYSRSGEIDNTLVKQMCDYLLIPDEFFTTEFYTDKKHYKCSVIINTYKENPEDLIAAIKSYQMQRNVDVEIIISTVVGDSSINIARSLGIEKVCISKNPGIFPQLNNALKMIGTDWYCYASGNDKALPNKCFTEINLCINSDKKICYSAYCKTDENFKITAVRKYHDYDFGKHLTGNFVSDCSMIHRSVIAKYSPFLVELGNEAYYDFWLRVYEGEGNIFLYNPTPTWLYRISEKSQHIRIKSDPEIVKKRSQDRIIMLKSHIQ